MKRILVAFAFVTALLSMTNCSNHVVNIPAGYVGKELTPKL